jgi:hypothetical protein
MKIDPATSAAMPTSHGLGARLPVSSAFGPFLDPFGNENATIVSTTAATDDYRITRNVRRGVPDAP